MLRAADLSGGKIGLLTERRVSLHGTRSGSAPAVLVCHTVDVVSLRVWGSPAALPKAISTNRLQKTSSPRELLE